MNPLPTPGSALDSMTTSASFEAHSDEGICRNNAGNSAFLGSYSMSAYLTQSGRR